MSRALRKEKASVLVLTLFVIFFLSTIALSISHAMRMNTELIRRHIQNEKSLYIAESALLIGLEELKADKQANNYDCFQDDWYRKFHDSLQEKIFRFKTNEGVDIGEYRINLVAESGRMNINTVSADIIANLINQLSKKDNTKMIQAIIDYRSGLGQKQIIRSVYELLNIKAMDKNIFWGEDTNDNAVLDKWEDDQANSLPDDNGNNILDPGLKDFFTVYTDGKINLNTASEKVLLTLPGMTEPGAQAIINMRKNQAFQTEKDFEDINSISKQTSQFIAQWGTARSDIFRIIVQAKVNEAKNYKQIVAIVDRSHDPLKILYWREN
jgi:general secretion pathway protein K